MNRTVAFLIALVAAVCMTSPAFAHYPFCTCAKEGGKIICKGGFSDGTSAEGVKLDVIAYDDKVLAANKFGPDSTVRFERPPGEFFVLFDAGPGHVVEVDWRDIEGLAP
jgi:hypothetical protein